MSEIRVGPSHDPGCSYMLGCDGYGDHGESCPNNPKNRPPAAVPVAAVEEPAFASLPGGGVDVQWLIQRNADLTSRLRAVEAEREAYRDELQKNRRPVYETIGNPSLTTTGAAPSRYLCTKCSHTFAAGATCEWCAIEADRARLDWLSDPAKGHVTIGLNSPPSIPECSLYVFGPFASDPGEPFDARSLREAIDRARAAASPATEPHDSH